ncbi:MAG: hypothetical protein WEB62_05600 [Bacteroidota bacterium]|jgi:ferritin
MNIDDLRCAHACRNSCGLLNEAMRRENEMVKFYQRVAALCDYPDVEQFVGEFVEERSGDVLKIVQKLNELQARGQALDGVMASYDPAGV